MKKALSLILTISLILAVLAAFSGCKAGGSTVQLKNLGKYTVVYPADWEDWQKEDVDVLVNAVEKLTGTKIAAVPDTEEVKTNTIIIAGASTKTAYDDEINGFASDMDYIIAVDNGDIVLGGKSYYADMRAIYDFVNNYLGYDDLTDTQGEAEAEVSDSKKNIYKEPAFSTLAINGGKYPFRTAADVKDMADAGFNIVSLELAKIDTDLYHEYGKWCARFDIRIVQRVVYDIRTGEFTLNDEEYSKNNPMFYGHYMKYEVALGDPTIYNAVTDSYKEKYSDYGWKFVMEVRMKDYYKSADGTEEANVDSSFMQNVDVVVLATEIADDNGERYHKRMQEIQTVANDARARGADFWMNVQYTSLGTEVNPKLYNWRAYVGLAFGAKGITYSTYKRDVIIKDTYEKTSGWNQAKMTNEDLIKTAEFYNNYEYVGTFARFQEIGDSYAVFDEPFTGFENIADLEDLFGLNYTYVVGCFKKKNGDGYALVITNVSVLDKMSYDSIIGLPILVKTDAQEAHLYVGGEEDTDTRIPGYDGYVSAMIVNGRGAFLTLD